MRFRGWLIGIAMAALLLTAPTHAGGPSAAITRIHGDVDIRPLQRGCKYRRFPPGAAMQIERFAPGLHWRRAKLGELGGTFLVRTGPRSSVHLNGDLGCVDSNSLVRIDSGCGFAIKVLRGKVSAVDGRSGPSLGRRFRDSAQGWSSF